MKAAVLALLFVAHCAEAASVSESQSFALRWLRAHAAPQQDDLAELKGVNPEAYAIVKALLTKRSLGLLDPKHPSASFAAPPPAQQVAPEDAGPEAFAKFQTPADAATKSSLPYGDAPLPAAHHDWLNWKPQSSAMDDDAMVKNVLGAVAELKAGGNLRGQAAKPAQPEDQLTWTEPAPVVAAPVAPAAAAPAVVAVPAIAEVAPAPKASMSQENSYLKDIDFGLKAPPAVEAAPAPVQENSYLKGLDLVGVAPAAPAQAATVAQVQPHVQAGGDPLASFSFDDAAPAAKPTPAAPKPVAKKAAGPSNALLAWLGGGAVKKAPAPKTAAIQEPQNAMSKYLADLQ